MTDKKEMPPTSLHPVYVYENMIEGGDPPYTNTPDTYESAPAGICYTFATPFCLLCRCFTLMLGDFLSRLKETFQNG